MTQASVPVLAVEQLSIAYHDGVAEQRTVHEVSFSIAAGEVLALVGESGSGKTTTAQSIIGLLADNGRVQAGSIRINGMKAGGKTRRFLFGSVKDSQAAKAGGETGARNVGVIGVAVYVEDEAAAKLVRAQEGLKRTEAQAFPGS